MLTLARVYDKQACDLIMLFRVFESDGHGDARPDANLRTIGRVLWNLFAVLKHTLHNHVDDVIDILERFSLRGAPG